MRLQDGVDGASSSGQRRADEPSPGAGNAGLRPPARQGSLSEHDRWVLGAESALRSASAARRSVPALSAVVCPSPTIDGFHETFIPRSRIPKYLLHDSRRPPSQVPGLRRSSKTVANTTLYVGDAKDLIPSLEPGSVQSVVTSSPYWGMRVYDNERNIQWADGESWPLWVRANP